MTFRVFFTFLLIIFCFSLFNLSENYYIVKIVLAQDELEDLIEDLILEEPSAPKISEKKIEKKEMKLPKKYPAANKVTVVYDDKGWKMVVDGKDFFIKGVTWSYTPIGENYSYDLWSKPDEYIKQFLDYEAKLMKEMGINAIRHFGTIPPKWVTYLYKNYGIYTVVNDLVGRYGVMVNGK